jgi:hypothetical protein
VEAAMLRWPRIYCHELKGFIGFLRIGDNWQLFLGNAEHSG